MTTFSRYNANLAVQDPVNGVVVSVSLKRKKLAIVGFEEANQHTAPLNDPAYEVWAFNHANRLGFMVDMHGDLRADRWFDLHEHHAQSELDMAWINACNVPIYLTDLYTDNPYAVRYPIEEITDLFGRYFCSSFAYALCLAVMEGFRHIELHGMNLNWGREYAVERGNLEYLIGMLRGRYDVHILTEGSPLLLSHFARYGFDYTEEKEAVERRMAALVIELLHDVKIREMVEHKITERTAELLKLQELVRGEANKLFDLKPELCVTCCEPMPIVRGQPFCSACAELSGR